MIRWVRWLPKPNVEFDERTKTNFDLSCWMFHFRIHNAHLRTAYTSWITWSVCVCLHKFVYECVPIQHVFFSLLSSNGKVFNALAFCSATSLKLHIWLFMFTLAEISAYLCWAQTKCWSRIVYKETVSLS